MSVLTLLMPAVIQKALENCIYSHRDPRAISTKSPAVISHITRDNEKCLALKRNTPYKSPTSKPLIVQPGKYAPIGANKKQITSPSAPMAPDATGPQRIAATAIGKKEKPILTSGDSARVRFEKYPSNILSANNIPQTAIFCGFFNMLADSANLDAIVFNVQTSWLPQKKRKAKLYFVKHSSAVNSVFQRDASLIPRVILFVLPATPRPVGTLRTRLYSVFLYNILLLLFCQSDNIVECQNRKRTSCNNNN